LASRAVDPPAGAPFADLAEIRADAWSMLIVSDAGDGWGYLPQIFDSRRFDAALWLDAAPPRVRTRVPIQSIRDFKIGGVQFASIDRVPPPGTGPVIVLARHLIEISSVLGRRDIPFVFLQGDEYREQTILGIRVVTVPPGGARRISDVQTPVSYLVLSWTGEEFELVEEKLFRSNGIEIKQQFFNLKKCGVAAAVGALLVGLAGWGVWARR
jgi:hypothetical protein